MMVAVTYDSIFFLAYMMLFLYKLPIIMQLFIKAIYV